MVLKTMSFVERHAMAVRLGIIGALLPSLTGATQRDQAIGSISTVKPLPIGHGLVPSTHGKLRTLLSYRNRATLQHAHRHGLHNFQPGALLLQ